jgi:hypothetical protein
LSFPTIHQRLDLFAEVQGTAAPLVAELYTKTTV